MIIPRPPKSGVHTEERDVNQGNKRYYMMPIVAARPPARPPGSQPRAATGGSAPHSAARPAARLPFQAHKALAQPQPVLLPHERCCAVQVDVAVSQNVQVAIVAAANVAT